MTAINVKPTIEKTSFLEQGHNTNDRFKFKATVEMTSFLTRPR
jgi:hypothetical protein